MRIKSPLLGLAVVLLVLVVIRWWLSVWVVCAFIKFATKVRTS